MLILHVVAALLLLGPVTVAVSTFHVRAREAHNGNDLARGSVRTLFTITNTYGLISLIVPLLGVGLLLSNMSYLREGRFHASILLSVIAWGILFFLIVPRQKKMMAALGLSDDDDGVPSEKRTGEATIENWDKAVSQLSMFGGIFSALWVIVAILMVI
jgi:integral membrane protein